MKQVLNYNIHNLIKFRIVRDRKWGFGDLMNLKFSAFQVDEIDKPDIILKIGKFTPSNRDCYLVDHKYYIRENYLYCRDSAEGATWEVEILGFEKGEAVINFNLIHRPFVKPGKAVYTFPTLLPQAFLFRLIEHRLGEKGYFLAHAAAVAKDEQGLLFAGRSGCFKTTLAMEFVRRNGYSWLGDDRVILGVGKILALPLNPRLLEFMTKHLPDETCWTFAKQLRFLSECLLSKQHENKKHKPDSVNLKAVFLINKSNNAARKVNFYPLPQSSLSELVEGFTISRRLEDFRGMGFSINAPFLHRYMLTYSFVFPENLLSAQEEKIKEKLRSVFQSVPICAVEIPPKYSPDIFHQITEFISRNC